MSNDPSQKAEDKKLASGDSHDGIEELDNSLPKWWINGFYLTIIFSVIYFFHFVLGQGPSLQTEYEREKRDYETSQLSQRKNVRIAGESELFAFLKEPARLKAGRDIFVTKCLSCHGAKGQGGIGPNLTDGYWIHGGKMTEIFKIVSDGVLDKGMPPWAPLLQTDEMYSVVAFVRSLRGSNPPNAKAPQGELIKE